MIIHYDLNNSITFSYWIINVEAAARRDPPNVLREMPRQSTVWRNNASPSFGANKIVLYYHQIRSVPIGIWSQIIRFKVKLFKVEISPIFWAILPVRMPIVSVKCVLDSQIGWQIYDFGNFVESVRSMEWNAIALFSNLN